jgi:cleavage and polyadenylation specificity factor subunit 1
LLTLIQVYALPNLSEPVFVTEGLSYIPAMLSTDFTVRKGTVKEALSQILVAALGDSVSHAPYLIVCTSFSPVWI